MVRVNVLHSGIIYGTKTAITTKKQYFSFENKQLLRFLSLIYDFQIIINCLHNGLRTEG